MNNMFYGLVIEYVGSYHFVPLCNVTDIKADKSGRRFEVYGTSEDDGVHVTDSLNVTDVESFLRMVRKVAEKE